MPLNKFGDYLYNRRIPEIYKKRDVSSEFKRYLEALGFGLDINLEEVMGLLNLISIAECPAKFLPLFAQNFGLTYDENLPERFQRLLIANIIELYRRKGTKSVVRYIARELSGYEAEIIEYPNTLPYLSEELPTLNNPNIVMNESLILNGDLGANFKPKYFVVRLIAPIGSDEDTLVSEQLTLDTINQFTATHSRAFIVTSYFSTDEYNIKTDITEYFSDNIIESAEEDKKTFTANPIETGFDTIYLSDAVIESNEYQLYTVNNEKLFIRREDLYLTTENDQHLFTKDNEGVFVKVADEEIGEDLLEEITYW